MEAPVEFNRWVSDNNPPAHLQYGKGWWDYIEIVRRLCWKFGIEDVHVLGTYRMNTPPPEEELTMPIIRMRSGKFEFIVKYDFGIEPEAWTVSVRGPNNPARPMFGLFNTPEPLGAGAARGLDPAWVYPPYSGSPGRFSCELADEWDLAALVRILTAFE